MAHNTIYEKLTANPNDPVGAFAYIIYKQQKVDFCKSFGGRDPTREELDSFHSIARLDTSIAAYRAQGEAMAQAFLNAGLDDLVDRTEAATRQDVLYRQIEVVHAGLGTKIATIDNALQAKRTFAGWLRDVMGNLLVNLVTIGVLGALVLGYQFNARLQQSTESKVGLAPVAPPTEGGAQNRASIPPDSR
ncbi:hypothetical protein [Janthinobacterium agaricidamnosum]|uniref:hypothetical protein n=1 Tax=Janthinobacterium agaricidamnosum TaxID=55508 RepID=UPI00056FF693|nr:hypothetical protein [Janthinobacterium agaricidamnosum]